MHIQATQATQAQAQRRRGVALHVHGLSERQKVG